MRPRRAVVGAARALALVPKRGNAFVMCGHGFGRVSVISGSNRSLQSQLSLSVNGSGEAVAAWESFAGSGAGRRPYKVRAALFRPR